MVDSSLDITSELLLTQNSLVLTALASLELVAEKKNNKNNNNING